MKTKVPENTPIRSNFMGREMSPTGWRDLGTPRLDDLHDIGICFDDDGLELMMRNSGFSSDDFQTAMDSIQGLQTTPSITVATQFLQNLLQGFVRQNTTARKIDTILGVMTAGDAEDEQVVQGFVEMAGSAVPYGDDTNIQYSSYNENWLIRNIVRFQHGIRVGWLQQKRAAKIRLDPASESRMSSVRALEIQRNAVGFLGFNGGNNQTYGLLNDPNLPNYVNFPNGASASPLWKNKTLTEITADIRTMVVALRTNSGDTIDPEVIDMTLVLPTAVVDRLTTNSDYGYSVRKWLTETYPRIRVVSAPEFNNANGGASAAYLFADRVPDESSDGEQTIVQIVPAKFLALGVKQEIKGFEEAYLNALAGVMVKRPYGVVRYSGL